MPSKPSAWKGENVILVPYKVSEERKKLLLTELAQILYDLSCQFRKQSFETDPKPSFGPSDQEAISE